MIDPYLSTPLLLCLLWSLRKKTILPHLCAAVWLSFYLLFSSLQHSHALTIQEKVILARGEEKIRGRVFPMLGNPFLWRSLYQTKDKSYVDDFYCPPLFSAQVEKGRAFPFVRGVDIQTGVYFIVAGTDAAGTGLAGQDSSIDNGTGPGVTFAVSETASVVSWTASTSSTGLAGTIQYSITHLA